MNEVPTGPYSQNQELALGLTEAIVSCNWFIAALRLAIQLLIKEKTGINSCILKQKEAELARR
jgi:hypothetical protein